jgi:hypothetical protein
LAAAATWHGQHVKAKERDAGMLQELDDLVHGSQPAGKTGRVGMLYH